MENILNTGSRLHEGIGICREFQIVQMRELKMEYDAVKNIKGPTVP